MDGLDPDDSWHRSEYVPRLTWKCRIGFHRWVIVRRKGTTDWRFYDDLRCWRCHKTKTEEVAMGDLFA